MRKVAETWEDFFELMEEYYETPQDTQHEYRHNGIIYDSCGCIIGEYKED